LKISALSFTSMIQTPNKLVNNKDSKAGKFEKGRLGV
jgi:hypothetical protein